MKESTRGMRTGGSQRAEFRSFLQGELARRCAENPQYSLRAFARRLETDHSTLSQILRGRRRLTEARIRDLGARLGQTAAAIEEFVRVERRLEEKKAAASDGAQDGDRVAASREIRELAHDAASLIAQWHHAAILELLRLRDFRPDSGWIARVLGISPDTVNVAIQRLCRLRMLEMQGDRWIDCVGDAAASLDDFAHAAIERWVAETRRLSMAALRREPRERVELSSMTLAVDTRQIALARERIAAMRREIADILGRGEESDAVYRLEIALFPVTRDDAEQAQDTDRRAQWETP